MTLRAPVPLFAGLLLLSACSPPAPDGSAPASAGMPAAAPAPPPTPAAAPSPAAVEAQAQVDAATYSVSLAAAPAAAGSPASAVVSLTARQGYHVNLEYPTAFRPEPQTGGLRFASERVSLRDLERQSCPAGTDVCAARYELPLVATTPGAHRLAGEVAFSVCNPEQCEIHKQALATTLTAR